MASQDTCSTEIAAAAKTLNEWPVCLKRRKLPSEGTINCVNRICLLLWIDLCSTEICASDGTWVNAASRISSRQRMHGLSWTIGRNGDLVFSTSLARLKDRVCGFRKPATMGSLCDLIFARKFPSPDAEEHTHGDSRSSSGV